MCSNPRSRLPQIQNAASAHTGRIPATPATDVQKTSPPKEHKMIDFTTEFGKRAESRLNEDHIIWLTSVDLLSTANP